MKGRQRIHFLKHYLLIFIPLALVVACVLLTFFLTETRSESRILKTGEANTISHLREMIGNDFIDVVSDLMILTQQHELQKRVNGNVTEGADLHHEFFSFSRWKKLYDQIRYLDVTGTEVARINFNNGKPAVVPKGKLQNKGKRYYFTDALKLNQGEVFVSPLDLNIEQGNIEQPLKPMIRFGTPVFDDQGRKQGIVLLNYFGVKMLGKLERYSTYTKGNAMLLNREGYWLKGPNSEEEWGFMYENRKDKTFANKYPGSWDTLRNAESGQFETSDGLFTFATIHPLLEGLKSSTGSSKAYDKSSGEITGKEYFWKIVTHVKPEVLTAVEKRVAGKLIPFYAGLLAILAVGCWQITRAKIQRRQDEEAIKKYTEKLQGSNDELQSFAYVASHDLQEPLRKITAFGDRLDAKFGDVLGVQGKNYLNRMQNAARRMQTLINDLLEYSRVTSKDQPFVSVDMAEIAQEVVSDLEVRIQETGGRVVLGALPNIDADPLQMRQLLQNLIGNGLKFHRPDEAPDIKITSKLYNGFYQLTVQDNGIGFEKEDTGRIFGVFERLHGRSQYEGSGIGLSICKKIVECHGGTIKANSKPGQGASFVITLPVK